MPRWTRTGLVNPHTRSGVPTYNNPAHRRFSLYLHQVRAVHVSCPSVVLGDCLVLVPCVLCLGGGGTVNCTSVSLFSFLGGTEGYKKSMYAVTLPAIPSSWANRNAYCPRDNVRSLIFRVFRYSRNIGALGNRCQGYPRRSV